MTTAMVRELELHPQTRRVLSKHSESQKMERSAV